MNINDEYKQSLVEIKSDLLISKIFKYFPPVRPDRLIDVVVQREWVDAGRMIEFFGGRAWLELG